MVCLSLESCGIDPTQNQSILLLDFPIIIIFICKHGQKTVSMKCICLLTNQSNNKVTAKVKIFKK